MQGANKTSTWDAVKSVLVTIGTYYLCWLPCGVWFVWNIANPFIPISGWFGLPASQSLFMNSGMGCAALFITPRFQSLKRL